jgi:hypothetical protein
LPEEIEDGGAASDIGKWLVNADSKGRQQAKTLKGVDNGLGLTKSQTSKGLTMGLGWLGPKHKKGRLGPKIKRK